MGSKEKENFLRNAILIVDHSKEALIALVDLDLSNNGLSFEQFLIKNQHKIYHLHNSSKCCQCPIGYNPPRTSRILHAQQMDLLFDRTSKLSCHKSGRSAEYCCSTARHGLRTDILDLTMARCLLVNFCLDVFWYSCLNHEGKTLEDFLNNHKHEIYHLWQFNRTCCECPPSGYSFPTSQLILDQSNFRQLYNALTLPCVNHRTRPSPGSMYSICSVAAMPGITVGDIGPFLSEKFLLYFCSLRKAVEILVKVRNEDFGHASVGEMTDQEYNRSVTNIENSIMKIASFCNKETYFKTKLQEAKHGTIQYSLYEKYKDCLTEIVVRQDEFNKGLSEILPKLDNIEIKIASKNKKLPSVIAEKVPKIIEKAFEDRYTDHEQNLEMFSSYFDKVKYQTKLEIQNHWTDGTYVETQAVRKCMKNLEKYDVFLICGSNGMGKSRIGLEVLRQIGEQDKGYDLVMLSDINQVKRIITGGRKLALFLDDIFCFSTCLCQKVQYDKVYDLLHARKSEGNIKIFFTVESMHKKLSRELFASHRLFQSRYDIDLSVEMFSMTHDEKKQILTKYCTKHKIKVQSVTNEDTYELILERRTFCQIVQTEPYMGYPKACFLFASNKGVFQLGVRFFTHTNKSLIDEIIALRDGMLLQDNVTYATLVYLLLRGNCISITEIDVQRLTAIMKSCGNTERCVPIHLTVQSMRNMDGKYVIYDSNVLKYRFKHQMIYEAVAISYFDVDPSSVISVLSYNCISGITRLPNYSFDEEESILIVPQDMYGNLAKRLLDILHTEFKTSPFEFVELLCETNIFLQDDTSFVKLLLKEFVACKVFGVKELNCPYLRDMVIFHFPAALLLYTTRAQKVHYTFVEVINTLKEDIKSERNKEIYEACSKVLLAKLSYLLEYNEVDRMFELVLESIVHCNIAVDFSSVILKSIQNNNYITGKYVLKKCSQKINIVELIMAVPEEQTSTFLAFMSESFDIPIYSGTNKIEMVKWLFKRTATNTFHLNSAVMTALSYKLESLLIWLLGVETNLKMDTTVIISTAYEYGWENVLSNLLHLNVCDMNSEKFLFSEACKHEFEKHVLWMLPNSNVSIGDVQESFIEALSSSRVVTIKCLILNAKCLTDIRQKMLNVLTNFIQGNCQDFYFWLLQEASKGFSEANGDYENLHLLKYLIEYFPMHRNEVLDNIYRTIDSQTSSYDYILRWFRDNTDPNILPIQFILAMSIKNGFKNVLVWILKNYNHQMLKISQHAIDVCKSRDKKLIETFFINVDHHQIDFTSVIQTVITIHRNKFCRELFLWFLLNSNLYHVRWAEIIYYIFKLRRYILCKDMRKYVDHTKHYMMIFIQNACENNTFKEDSLTLILANISIDLLDINYIMSHACLKGYLSIVVWLINNVDHLMINMLTIVNQSCIYGRFDIFKYALENVNHTLFDMKRALNTACENKRLDNVMYLIENVDHAQFDRQTALNRASDSGCLDIIMYFLQDEDHKLFDLKTTMNIACQNNHLNIVKHLMENVDHALLDKRLAIQNACNNIIKYFIKNVDHTLFDMNKVMKTACISGRLDFIKYLVKHIDNTLFDMKAAMNSASSSIPPDVVMFFIENFDSKLLDMEVVLNVVCRHGYLDTVKTLIENVDNTLFDFKSAMNKAYKYGRLAIVKFFIENIPHTLFDINAAIDKVYDDKRLGIVKYLMKNIDHKLFDKQILMNIACKHGWLEIVKNLMENNDLKLFDMKKSMITACSYTRLNIVKYFTENVDHDVFDIKTPMEEACRFGHTNIVRYIMEVPDYLPFDTKTALNTACQYGLLEIARNLMANVDHSLFDMKAAMNTACKHGSLDIVKNLMENKDYSLFDMKTAMEEACNGSSLVVVKYLMKNVDHTLFDMKMAMNEACHGGLSIVKFLIENFDYSLFDMKSAMHNAFEAADCNLLQFFIENGHYVPHDIQELIDTIFQKCFWSENIQESVLLFCNMNKEQINWDKVFKEACSAGYSKIVEWLLMNIAHDIFDLNASILRILQFDDIDFSFEIITLILDKCDHTLLDLKTVMNDICRFGLTSIANEILINEKLSTFDLKTIMNEACRHDDNTFVMWLWESADHNAFDMKIAMINCCRGLYTSQTLEWLCANVDRDLFDMELAMDNACAYGREENVKWLWMNNNTEIFQMNNAIPKACNYNHVSTVEWLTENISKELLDIPNALLIACSNSKCNSAKIVQILLENTDRSNLNINSLIEEASKYSKIDIVQYLLNCTEVDMNNLSQALKSVFAIDKSQNNDKKLVNQGQQKLVLLILEKSSPEFIDIESVIIESYKHNWLDIVEYIWLKFNHEYFKMGADKIRIACEYGNEDIIQWSLNNISLECIDINFLMLESCGYGWLNIVKRMWNHEHVNPDKLDMKTAMNDACTFDRLEIVTWLLQNIEHTVFEISVVLIESCRKGWIDIVKTVTQNGDPTFYNITLCITEACTNSRLEVIEYMYTTYGTNHFDLKNIFECESKESENEGVTMFLIRNFNIDSVYIPTIVTRAFSLGWTKVVKWIVEEFKYNGDLAKPLNNACENGEAEIVKYLLQNIPNEKLDLKYAMLSACNKGWDDIVALLLQNVDHQKLNVRNAVIEACRCEDSNSVVLIIRQVDHKLIDLNAVLIEICKHSTREQLVLSILKTADSSEFDRNIVMEKAKKHNWRKVLLFLDI